VDALDAVSRVPPTVRNTDGDPLVLTTDRFEIVAEAPAVAAGLASIEGAEVVAGSAEAPRVYTFSKAGAAEQARWERTIVGHARLSETTLTLETNSRERADALRARVEAACGDRIRHRGREHVDPLSSAIELAAFEAEREQPPEVEQLLLDFKQHHYADWADQSLPALGGRTPRQAVRTRAGRAEVDLLLKSLENSEERRAGAAGLAFDFTELRRELGLD
jgi:hypothetical protein